MPGPRNIKLSSVRKSKVNRNRIRSLSDHDDRPTRADPPRAHLDRLVSGVTAQLPWPIEMVPIQRLKPAKRNPRSHPEKQVERLVKNIHQFDFTSAVLADDDLNLIGGHLRVEAAKRAGMTTIPVIIISGLSEAEKRALALADNKIPELGGWLQIDLAQEINDLAPMLEKAGLDFGLTGFETAEHDSLMRAFVDPERDPIDKPPDISEGDPVSRPGDQWLMDPHRLQCGDATNPTHIRELMGRERAAMVITDPPYNLQIRTIQGRGKIKHREFAQASGEMSPDQFIEFLRASLSLAAQYSTNGSIHFVFMDWRHGAEMYAAGEAVYTELKNIIVWAKTNAGQGTFYKSQHEWIFVFKNGDAPHINNFQLGQFGRARSNLWTYAGVNTFRAGRLDDLSLHPTVKPIALVADAMRDCSRRGDIVLDPFMGSGTTILAAERVGRRGYGLELDALYVDAAIRRWQHFTKRDATLADTGQTFDEIADGAARSRRRR